MKSFMLVISLLTTLLNVGCNANASGGPQAPEGHKGEQARPPVAPASKTPSSRFISITSPTANEQVSERTIISGTVTDSKSPIIVVVHPMEVEDYWVQPAVAVMEDNTWEVQAHVGRPGDVDLGKHFQIMAIANPKGKYKAGQMLNGWPDGNYKSQIIRVTRKN